MESTRAKVGYLLQPSDDEVRWYEEVMALDKRDAVPVLINILSDQQESLSIRKQAALILGLLHDERSISGLVQALHEPDRVLRARAAEALGQFETLQENALEELMRGLHDEDYFVRECCAKALGQLKYSKALPALTEMSATDNVPTNREVAQKAVEAIREKT